MEVFIKLFLAMVLGGLIGLEREIGNRPAGFRTHTLVCMGSALVLLTSEFIFNAYSTYTFADPGRLGAQVISGIGFLGAGTILKDGSRVRGLTTAASLWVVACIGLAIGAGFYWGAISACILSYITLVLFKKIEANILKEPRKVEIIMDIRNIPGQISMVTKIMAKLNVRVRDIKVMPGEEKYVQSSFKVVLPSEISKAALIAELELIEGIIICKDDNGV